MSTFPKHDLIGEPTDPPAREPTHDRLTVPPLSEQDTPSMVRVCPWCGSEVRHRAGDEDAIDECFECETIVEGQAVCVPADVFEIGVETTLAWIKAQKEGPHGAA